MKIDGLALQQEIITGLGKKIQDFKKRGINPHIAIVTLGDEATWQAYVGQKIKLSDKLGIEKTLINLNPRTTEEVIRAIEELNNDPSIHGIIVQRPFPSHIDTKRVIKSVKREKDIDGFRDDSPYEVPVFLAVLYILSSIEKAEKEENFLQNKRILVVGKGETAGNPVIKGLIKRGYSVDIIDSQTENKEEKFSNADIIISAVGKTNVISPLSLKQGAILIGIGIHRGEDGLEGDYNEEAVKDRVAHYTPTPKGVGPVNLAFLFTNLIEAAKRS